MGLITKGMGAILKKASTSVKQGIVAPKTNKPLAALVSTFEVGRHAYNKLTGKKDIHAGTITGVIKEVKKGIKKVIKKKKDKK